MDYLSNFSALNIPSIEELLAEYYRVLNLEAVIPKEWTFYMSYTFFKYASILQGVYKRGLQGQASQAESLTFKEVPKTMANIGLRLIKESGAVAEPRGEGVFSNNGLVPRPIRPRRFIWA